MKQIPPHSSSMGRLGGVSLLLLFISSATFAAEAPPRRISERISVETRLFPFSKLKDPPRGTPHENLEIQPENIKVRLGLPPIFFRDKKGLLAPSLSYEQIHFNYRNWDPSYEPYRVDTLHSIGVSLFYRQPFQASPWGFSWFLSSSLASDFQVISSKSIRIQGGGFFTRKVPGGNLSLGLALIDSFGRPRVFPAVGYDPAPDARHKFTMRIPVEASYFYCPDAKWEAGVAARVSGLNAEITEGGVYERKTVAYSAGTVGPSLRYKLSKNFTLSLDGGWVPYHRFQVLNKKDKLRDYDMSTPYFFSAGLKLSL